LNRTNKQTRKQTNKTKQKKKTKINEDRQQQENFQPPEAPGGTLEKTENT